MIIIADAPTLERRRSSILPGALPSGEEGEALNGRSGCNSDPKPSIRLCLKCLDAAPFPL